jgi:hypothetical protein
MTKLGWIIAFKKEPLICYLLSLVFFGILLSLNQKKLFFVDWIFILFFICYLYDISVNVRCYKIDVNALKIFPLSILRVYFSLLFIEILSLKLTLLILVSAFLAYTNTISSYLEIIFILLFYFAYNQIITLLFPIMRRFQFIKLIGSLLLFFSFFIINSQHSFHFEMHLTILIISSLISILTLFYTPYIFRSILKYQVI